MNPESSSYGETLHEDSYEYSGDMMLMKVGNPLIEEEKLNLGTPTLDTPLEEAEDTQITLKEGAKNFWIHKTTGTRIEQEAYGNLRSETSITNPAHTGQGRESYKKGGTEYPVYKKSEGGSWQPTGEYSSQIQGAHYDNLGSAPTGDFSYSEEGSFDPTSEEFKTSVEEAGGFGELAAGYGQEGGDFEEFYGKPLEFWEEEYGTEIDPETGKAGTLAEGRGLDLATIAETQRAEGVTLDIEETKAEEAARADYESLTLAGKRATEAERAGTTALDIAGTRATEGLRAATAGAKIGRRSAGLQAGQSLSNIFAQTAAQQEKGGFGPGGAASATARRAQRGVMGDYNLQQQQLAEGMTQARSAFDVSQQEIASGRTGVKSAFDISQAEIASGTIGMESAYSTAWKGIQSGRTGAAETARIDTARTELGGTQADIDYRRKQADFWKGTEDEFYERLNFLESL